MNRAQRRNANAPKSSARKAGLTYLTVAGVVGGTIGLASPAHAAVYTPANCTQLASDLTSLTTIGGTLTANFTGSCDFAEGYIFQLATTIIGPTSGSLTLNFTNSASSGFTAYEEFTISNLNFTRQSNQTNFSYFINSYNPGNQPQPLTVSNVTFSDSEVTASAIYAEGNLTVSDSTFENLTSYSGGVAITTGYNHETVITNSTFTANKSIGLGQGGTINSYGALTVANSTFDSNESDFQAGAIYALYPEPKIIYNSTFIDNSAGTAAAASIFFSEGGVIANSTFWNNGDADTYSIGMDDPSITYLFANILANDTPSTVKLIDPTTDTVDLGANLYTDNSFNDTTSGTGSSELVTSADLKLSALALNQSAPTNTGATKTAAIATDSVAYDFYSADSAGINPTANSTISLLLASLDQRGAARPFGAGYDVGAFESGASPSEETEKENLADTGLPTNAGYLGLVGLGAVAIVGGTVGQFRRRKKA